MGMPRDAEKQLQSAFRMSDSGELSLGASKAAATGTGTATATTATGAKQGNEAAAQGTQGTQPSQSTQPTQQNEGRPPPHVALYLWLSRCYLRMDQPLNAIQVCEKGLERFAQSAQLLKSIARVHEVRAGDD